MKGISDGSGSFDSQNYNVPYSTVEKIIQDNCTSCHQTSDATNGFVSLATYDDMVFSGVIAAGDALSSPLYVEIASGRMPPSRPLSQLEENQIRGWIDNGAVAQNSATGNSIPTVNAGPDQTLNLPQSTITISGVATDTDGAVISTNWSQLSGPSTAQLSGRSTLNLTVFNVQPGVYVFELFVQDDDGDSSADQMTLTVVAAPNPPPPPAQTTFQTLNTTIFAPRCVGCHSGAMPAGNYDMSTYAGIMSRVTVNNPAMSLLFTRVNDDSMPRNGTPLTAAEKSAISDWISAGAPNN